jgi:large subunit ribosomal protein L1
MAESAKNVTDETSEATQEAVVVGEEKKTKVTKAGKRSAKAIAEAEEEKAKEERKAKVASGEINPSEEGVRKGAVPVARTRIERRAKNYKKAYEKIDHTKEYSLSEALKLASETSPVKFDATVELHINLGVDPKQADQNIRGNLVLPSGTGKDIKVAVFGNADDIKAAKAAGADIAGEADLLANLKKEIIEFDILISSPQMMAQLGQFARLLGPRGLMPNPKSGTVTKDVASAVKQAKAGMVEYRVDPTGIIHLGIGKVSFGEVKLLPNAEAVINSIKAAKPSGLKGNYIEKVTVTTSMGPSITVKL